MAIYFYICVSHFVYCNDNTTIYLQQSAENKKRKVNCYKTLSHSLLGVLSFCFQVYRFKENLMWMVDEDGYYSSSTAHYVTYENPSDFGPNTTRLELEALRSALAIAIASHRILILPSFSCCMGGCVERTRSTCSNPRFRCSLLSVLRISTFDRAFGGRYREHSFLNNSLVPDQIKRNLSIQPVLFNVSALHEHNSLNSSRVPDHVKRNSSMRPILFNVLGYPEAWHLVDRNSVQLLNVANYTRGATLSDVVRWMSTLKHITVIRFHSLYGNSIDWESDPEFGSKLKRWFDVAFDCSEYEQWDHSMLNLANMWPGKNTSAKH